METQRSFSVDRGRNGPRKKRILSILIAVVLVFIWGNSLLPRSVSGRISDSLMERMNAAAASVGLREDLFVTMHDQDGDGEEEPTSYGLRKAAHVTEYAVLAILVWMRLESPGRKRLLTAFALCAAAAALDETIQIFSHRGALFTDVLIDSAGAALGLALAAVFLKDKKRP